MLGDGKGNNFFKGSISGVCGDNLRFKIKKLQKLQSNKYDLFRHSPRSMIKQTLFQLNKKNTRQCNVQIITVMYPPSSYQLVKNL